MIAGSQRKHVRAAARILDLPRPLLGDRAHVCDRKFDLDREQNEETQAVGEHRRARHLRYDVVKLTAVKKFCAVRLKHEGRSVESHDHRPASRLPPWNVLKMRVKNDSSIGASAVGVRQTSVPAVTRRLHQLP